MLNEQELVAEADEQSHAAPPSGAESCPEVAHRVVVELAQVLEQLKSPFVFADAEPFVSFTNVHREADFFRWVRDHLG